MKKQVFLWCRFLWIDSFQLTPSRWGFLSCMVIHSDEFSSQVSSFYQLKIRKERTNSWFEELKWILRVTVASWRHRWLSQICSDGTFVWHTVASSGLTRSRCWLPGLISTADCGGREGSPHWEETPGKARLPWRSPALGDRCPFIRESRGTGVSKRGTWSRKTTVVPSDTALQWDFFFNDNEKDYKTLSVSFT